MAGKYDEIGGIDLSDPVKRPGPIKTNALTMPQKTAWNATQLSKLDAGRLQDFFKTSLGEKHKSVWDISNVKNANTSIILEQDIGGKKSWAISSGYGTNIDDSGMVQEMFSDYSTFLSDPKNVAKAPTTEAEAARLKFISEDKDRPGRKATILTDPSKTILGMPASNKTLLG